MSGENNKQVNEGDDLVGSSPRERGKPGTAIFVAFRVGLIPA